MKNPKFTIIIPCLNEAKFLPLLLQDLANQTYGNFEVIVVDGNSEDGTPVAAMEFKDKINIQVQEVTVRNVSYQRNFGASKAGGEYLVFLDADARIDADYLDKLAVNTDKSKALVYIPYIKSNYNLVLKVGVSIYNNCVRFLTGMGRPLSTGGSMIWEKDFFKLTGGFDETIKIGEDHVIIGQALLWGVYPKTFRESKIVFSMRRVAKEGFWTCFRKASLSIIPSIFNVQIRKQPYAYEMGGGSYNPEEFSRSVKESA